MAVDTSLVASSSALSLVGFRAKGEETRNVAFGQHWTFYGGYGQLGYNGREDEFQVKLRVRLQLNFVSSEDLYGHLSFGTGASE